MKKEEDYLFKDNGKYINMKAYDELSKEKKELEYLVKMLSWILLGAAILILILFEKVCSI